MTNKLTVIGRRIVLAAATCLTVTSSTVVWADTVKSVSVTRTIEGPPQVWEASVRCNRYKKPIVMRKKAKNDKWCSLDVPSECHKKKLSLSRRFCADKFISQLQNSNGSDLSEQTNATEIATAVQPKTAEIADSKAILLQEQNQINEQLLIIRNKREELRKRADELKKSQ